MAFAIILQWQGRTGTNSIGRRGGAIGRPVVTLADKYSLITIIAAFEVQSFLAAGSVAVRYMRFIAYKTRKLVYHLPELVRVRGGRQIGVSTIRV